MENDSGWFDKDIDLLYESISSNKVGAAQAFILTSIAFCVDADKTAKVSLVRLSRRCGCSESTIIRNLNALRDKGILSWEKVIVNGRKINAYKFNPERVTITDSFAAKSVASKLDRQSGTVFH